MCCVATRSSSCPFLVHRSDAPTTLPTLPRAAVDLKRSPPTSHRHVWNAGASRCTPTRQLRLRTLDVTREDSMRPPDLQALKDDLLNYRADLEEAGRRAALIETGLPRLLNV